jgi:hypothetical protein
VNRPQIDERWPEVFKDWRFWRGFRALLHPHNSQTVDSLDADNDKQSAAMLYQPNLTRYN